VEFSDKPLKDWTDEEIGSMLKYFENYSMYLLNQKLQRFEYMRAKRKIIQPFVNRIYDETFDPIGNVTSKITQEEYDYIESWVNNKFLKEKKGEKGWRGDNWNAAPRVINGTCGNLAVVKFCGGGMSDMDWEVGPSGKFKVPDLKKFLDGLNAGVKAARTGKQANLPLVLSYTPYRKKPKKELVEAQVFVGQNDRDKLKYYIIGVAKPEDIINGSSSVFTLDPSAMNKKKAGGAKHGFFKLYDTVHFKSKKELKEILNRKDFKAMTLYL
jgi:hypothetical protein